LPSFPYPNVTIRHLLTHTSGLPDLNIYEELAHQFPDSIIDNRSIIPTLRQWQKPLHFTPGDKWRYCNTNYDLLALVIEKASGLPFSDYLQRHIFHPAGMRSSFVRTKKAKSVTPWVRPVWYSNDFVPSDSVARYRYINYNLSGLVGSTGIITTLKDLLCFDAAVFSYQLLSKSSLELATTPVKLNDGTTYYEGSMDTFLGEGKGSYGMGWSLFDLPTLGKAVGHGGFNYGLFTFYFHRLAPAQTVIAFDNTASPTFARMVTSAALLLGGQPHIGRPAKKSLARIYGMALKDSGPDAAIVLLNGLRADTAHYYLEERELNWLGYDFLRASFEGHLPLALETLKLNTVLFPNSFNVYDSYAEALLKAGKKELARAMYQKSLLLNPENKGAVRALEGLK
ncbi:MAG TPA: serine hydrolase, partial [Chitinophagaceae bacterium]|jgi:CubicO group peptidase (beta-lactamase class C family)|nr:serine hydrolase [Chitinophagaceae bacterium]